MALSHLELSAYIPGANQVVRLYCDMAHLQVYPVFLKREESCANLSVFVGA